MSAAGLQETGSAPAEGHTVECAVRQGALDHPLRRKPAGRSPSVKRGRAVIHVERDANACTGARSPARARAGGSPPVPLAAPMPPEGRARITPLPRPPPGCPPPRAPCRAPGAAALAAHTRVWRRSAGSRPTEMPVPRGTGRTAWAARASRSRRGRCCMTTIPAPPHSGRPAVRRSVRRGTEPVRTAQDEPGTALHEREGRRHRWRPAHDEAGPLATRRVRSRRGGSAHNDAGPRMTRRGAAHAPARPSHQARDPGCRRAARPQGRSAERDAPLPARGEVTYAVVSAPCPPPGARQPDARRQVVSSRAPSAPPRHTARPRNARHLRTSPGTPGHSSGAPPRGHTTPPCRTAEGR